MAGSTRPPVKSPEDPLYAAEVNWLREQAERPVRMPVGFASDAGLTIGDPTQGPYRFYAFNEEAVDIPPYALFTIKYDERTPDRAYVRPNLGKHGVDGTPLLLCTNESVPIKGGNWGVARPVPFNEPVRLWTETEVPVGHMAGPRPGTFEAWADGCGLVVLSKRDPDHLAQWMLRAPEPVGFVGVVTEAITAATIGTESPPVITLGKGRIKFRRKKKDSDQLEDFKNPGEADDEGDPVPWDALVYSRRGWQVPVNTVVRGSFVMGVGLMIDDNPGVLVMKTQTGGIAAGGSGVCDLYEASGAGVVLSSAGTVINPFSSVATQNRKILALPEAMSGRLVGISEDCPAT